MFLTAGLALNLARQGDHENARTALIAAHRRADELDIADADGVEGPFACTISRIGGFWSDTHLTLGEPDEALRLADTAVHLLESAPPEHRNFGSERMVRCQQVKAHLAMRTFDGASEALRPVLQTDQQHRVGPLVRRVAEIMKLVQTAQAHGDTALLQEMRDGAADFVGKSVAAPRSIGWDNSQRT